MSSLLSRSTQPVGKLWLAASLAAGCETWINFDACPGVNWLLTTLLASGVFAAFVCAGAKPLCWRRMLPLLTACVLAGGAAITASALIDTLILLGVLGLMAVALLTGSSAIDPDRFGVRELLIAPALAGYAVLRQVRSRVAEALGHAQAESSLSVLRGIALAAPVTLVFALLLSHADPLLGYWRDSVTQMLEDLSLLRRTICFAAFGMVSLGSFGMALVTTAEPDVLRPTPASHTFALGATERKIVVGAVVSLFGFFLLLQLSHLFGDSAAVRGNGVTYAQAAHQGFAELTVVASLCAALIIALTQSGGPTGLPAIERALCLVLILQTQLLLVSAFRRLNLYEHAYGYTELRLFVQAYIIVVGIGFAELALELLGRPDFNRLARRCAITAALALTALVYWNHAGWIALANLRRYQHTHMLDVSYIVGSLGPDAVPEIIDYLPQLPPPMQNQLRSCLLHAYASSGHGRAAPPSWYEWSYRRSLLDSALDRAQSAAVADSGSLPANASCS